MYIFSLACRGSYSSNLKVLVFDLSELVKYYIYLKKKILYSQKKVSGLTQVEAKIFLKSR